MQDQERGEFYQEARAAAVAAHTGTTVFANGVTAAECFGFGYDAGCDDVTHGRPYWVTENADWDAGYAAAARDFENGSWT